MNYLEDQLRNVTNGMATGTWRDHIEAQTELLRRIRSAAEWTVVLLVIFGLAISGLLIWISLRLHP